MANNYLKNVRNKVLGLSALAIMGGASNASADNQTSPVKDTVKKTEIKANNAEIGPINGYDVIKDKKLLSVASELGLYGEMIGRDIGHGVFVGGTNTSFFVYDSRVGKGFSLIDNGNSNLGKYLFSTYDEKNNSSDLAKFNVNDNHLRPIDSILEVDEIRKAENIAPYDQIRDIIEDYEVTTMLKAGKDLESLPKNNGFMGKLQAASPRTYDKAVKKVNEMTNTKTDDSKTLDATGLFLAQQAKGIND